MRKMWRTSGSMRHYNHLMSCEEARQDTIEDNERRLEITDRLDVAWECIGNIWDDEDDLKAIRYHLDREERQAEARVTFGNFWDEFYALPYFRAL